MVLQMRKSFGVQKYRLPRISYGIAVLILGSVKHFRAFSGQMVTLPQMQNGMLQRTLIGSTVKQ